MSTTPDRIAAITVDQMRLRPRGRHAHPRPKTGLLHALEVGQLYLTDIGIPPAVYRRLGIDVPNLFARSPAIAVPTGPAPSQ